MRKPDDGPAFQSDERGLTQQIEILVALAIIGSSLVVSLSLADPDQVQSSANPLYSEDLRRILALTADLDGALDCLYDPCLNPSVPEPLASLNPSGIEYLLHAPTDTILLRTDGDPTGPLLASYSAWKTLPDPFASDAPKGDQLVYFPGEERVGDAFLARLFNTLQLEGFFGGGGGNLELCYVLPPNAATITYTPQTNACGTLSSNPPIPNLETIGTSMATVWQETLESGEITPTQMVPGLYTAYVRCNPNGGGGPPVLGFITGGGGEFGCETPFYLEERSWKARGLSASAGTPYLVEARIYG